MPTTLKLVAGNTAPNWVITCEREDVPINLTNCTVTLIIAKGNTITNTGGSASITSAAGGIISYTPTSTDIPTSGAYKIDVKITYIDASFEILYEQLKVKARKAIIS